MGIPGYHRVPGVTPDMKKNKLKSITQSFQNPNFHLKMNNFLEKINLYYKLR